jgi:3-oxo-5alpha-steroid 4-dehydrogenase
VWRFLSPPPALLHGVLVDADGKRIGDESRYGAATGAEIVRRGGRAWLFADRATIAEARRQLPASTLWFQRLQASYLLTFGRVTAGTVAGAAARAGVDPDGLAATVAAYNAGAGADDQTGKPADQVRPQDQPPFSLIDYSIRPMMLNPTPVLTLGGLVVDQQTGAVLRADGTPVPRLFAAGRSAVGLCSRSYVSGLSIADCVFSGRRAGRHAADGGQARRAEA